ncbi:hypothetical protein M1105_19715 [Limibaculum sp. FT325]|uniref:hypothetical protein n=1 Tax=Thermohalobaculum sediminis TaxID=2939436 RepID=UPI0020BE85DD|nr:hypothetical protein [Limibaculum sediminis]MCL5779194.1 hypothetical protein [Limibaculum sediminis]
MGIDEFERISLDQLTLSDGVVSVLRDIIELSDYDDVVKRVSGLLREHQIFLARWRSNFAPDRDTMIVLEGNIRQRTVSWAYLGAISASLFPYARHETDEVSSLVGEREIAGILNTAGVADLHAEDYAQEIGLYARTFARRFQ